MLESVCLCICRAMPSAWRCCCCKHGRQNANGKGGKRALTARQPVKEGEEYVSEGNASNLLAEAPVPFLWLTTQSLLDA
jgi:hypothetical protein